MGTGGFRAFSPHRLNRTRWSRLSAVKQADGNLRPAFVSGRIPETDDPSARCRALGAAPGRVDVGRLGASEGLLLTNGRSPISALNPWTPDLLRLRSGPAALGPSACLVKRGERT
ncbi:hypothetical protein EYF80_057354 [Liparis tanakae]|uniref:Uncharacterized protein n=1 Tax=Liparis tanakae TaxID=230148 RepID=A0A4Z2EU86_9TELE|nr:hypothetical protein EYF80_057354 [Liparis tanakae]